MSIDDIRLARRSFLKNIVAAGGLLAPVLAQAGSASKWIFTQPARREFPGSIIGASAKLGHQLRKFPHQKPVEEKTAEVVIVGAGISGLSAAWRLQKSGVENIVMLELEDSMGGNSRSGTNAVSAYPWAAHYIPVPDSQMTLLQELFEEFGIINGRTVDGKPVYNEYYLCAAPQERLKIHGRWQEGIVPQLGITDDDQQQYQAFFNTMQEFRNARGGDGKPAFTIPLDWSSRDKKYRQLDQISMSDYCRQHQWTSKPLIWYIDYCCRDDYGLGIENISAWAGIHYFAGRSSHGKDEHPILTWPEGNGWLVKAFLEKLHCDIKTSALVSNISQQNGSVMVDYLDVRQKQTVRIHAQQVVFAAPRFTAHYIIEELQKNKPNYLQELHYSPWLVANITLRKLPAGNGMPLCWDNVNFDGRSLGYVVATHQALQQFKPGTVVTWYQPLDHLPPVESRKEALLRTHAQWSGLIVADMERMHPGITDDIVSIDVCVWGHGMIAPVTGFIWGDTRQQMHKSLGNIHFAHSDMSGISIFEEAFYRGVAAADSVYKCLLVNGVRHKSAV